MSESRRNTGPKVAAPHARNPAKRTDDSAPVSREPPTTTQMAGRDEFERAFHVSRETLCRLEAYAGQLVHWQKTINLVAPNTLPDLWHRHFADSAQLYPLIPAGARHLVDLGSGGGFPGLVLAILAYGDPARAAPESRLAVTLVESDARKAAFLREVARQLGIAVDILSTRIESIHKSSSLAPVDVVTSRALAPLPRLFELVESLFRQRTVALFLKGRTAEAEIEESRKTWRFELDLQPSVTDTEARIVMVRDLKRNQGGRGS